MDPSEESTTHATRVLSLEDQASLKVAVESLETQPLVMQLVDLLGVPIEAVLSVVPKGAQGKIDRLVEIVLNKCLDTVLALDSSRSGRRPWNRMHKLATAATGAAGGFFSVPGFFIELPITTAIMIHSIIEIARNHGEDLSQPENALACLQVFALGPDRGMTGTMNGAYYSSRAALRRVTQDAATRIADGALGKQATQPVISFLSKIAARFGVEVTDKLAAQAVPVAGAAGGAAVNLLFTAHFQRIAEAHFTVRQLEREYGEHLIQNEYDTLRRVHSR